MWLMVLIAYVFGFIVLGLLVAAAVFGVTAIVKLYKALLRTKAEDW